MEQQNDISRIKAVLPNGGHTVAIREIAELLHSHKKLLVSNEMALKTKE